jgi:hypothetical protein
VSLLRKLLSAWEPTEVGELKPYTSLLPLGWYMVEYDAVADGVDEITYREMLLVFEDEYDAYLQYLAHLLKEDLADFAKEEIVLEQFRVRLEGWQATFFGHLLEPVGGQARLDNLFHLARHIAQAKDRQEKGILTPKFYLFEERDNHNLDLIAQEFSLNQDLGARKLAVELLIEYQRVDRFWNVLYPEYSQFKNHYDICVNQLLEKDKPKESGKKPPVIDPPPPIPPEPSEEVKRVVKEKYGNKCLACGILDARRLQVDHVLSRYRGGTSEVDNLQPLCAVCNKAKGTKFLDFRIAHTVTQPEEAGYIEFDLPSGKENGVERANFLRRTINFVYGCPAVHIVHIGREQEVQNKQGKKVNEWVVILNKEHNLGPITPHLSSLTDRINQGRRKEGYKEILLKIHADGYPYISE